MIDIAICDDDENDLNIVVRMLEDILMEQKISFKLYIYSSAKKLLQEVKSIDIGILDISMNELNGIELGKKIKIKFPNVTLMYITSFKDYCVKAINDAHAFSFLCKPLKREKLNKQLIEVINNNYINKENIERIFYNINDDKGKEFLSKKIVLADILYFEYIKSKRRVAIFLEDKAYEFPYVMGKLVDELKEYNFEVNCRGYLVNLEHITKIKGYNVYLDNDEVLPLSQKRAIKFKERINEFLHNNL